MRNFKTLMKRFFKNRSGNVSLMFGLAAVPLMMAGGAAVDYMRASAVQSVVQTALDSAAMAAATNANLSDVERIKLAKDMFARNFDKKLVHGFTANPVVDLSGNKVKMSVDMQVPMTLMKLANINTLDFTSTTEVNIANGKKAEIALVLDYSGSMSSTSGGKIKYVAMREAAIDLVEGLTSGPSADKVKFGLVPFSHHVQVSLPGQYVLGAPAGQTWTGCTQDRKYPYNTTDATPLNGNDDTKWGQAHAPAHAAAGCSGYVANNLVVKPISDDHTGVVSQLNSMTPYAWTHIALGFEYGWHLVSDTAPFTDVASNTDTGTQKYIILLTDGAQTEPAFGPGGSRNVAKGEHNLETLCAGAKAQGITVVTVAFDLNRPATENRLKNCSTDPDKHFFIAGDGAALASVFDQIKAAITAEVFISK